MQIFCVRLTLSPTGGQWEPQLEKVALVAIPASLLLFDYERVIKVINDFCADKSRKLILFPLVADNQYKLDHWIIQASEQQHKQDLRRIYRREYEFSNSSLFTRMHRI